ncbi:glutaredoxin domain-containing protein [Fusibacter sp. 3D3]|uniref:glutaredoxin family protein n=1 Tax=Fusibacter sp. 3D3 TaxID=1048380 RepID=UPI000853DF8A|nr:glutaredoxin domain-containing protein [Fusibacter sp. 3D3]GAU78092.1 glutaredoxin and related proteins [Fusibacter sp. 3D3]
MKEIVMFTSNTCPHCRSAKAYLDEKGYKYIEKNVQLDQFARQEMMSRKMMGVPAFIIGNESVVGLDRFKLEALIDYTVEVCPHCNHRTRVPKGKGKVKVICKKCTNDFVVQTRNM